MENDEFERDGLKLPSDDEEEDEEEDDDEDGPGLFGDDDGDDEDFDKVDDYGEEKGDAKGQDDETEDGEAELEDVFARAKENQEMDIVENLRRQADNGDKDTEFINTDLVKKIEQIEDEMMNPKPW